METASLAVGFATLASLYSSCITCFDQVEIARNFEISYETCLCKLAVVQLRLARWGQCIGFQSGTIGRSIPLDNNLELPPNEIAKAESILGAILDIFEKTEIEAFKIDSMTRKREIIKPPSNKAHPHPWYSTTLLELAKRRSTWAMQAFQQGQNKAKIVSGKAKWAIIKEKQFQHLIKDVNDLVGALIDLFPAFQRSQDEWAAEDVENIVRNRRETIKADSKLCHELDILCHATTEDLLFKEHLERMSNSIRSKPTVRNMLTDESSTTMFGNFYSESYHGRSCASFNYEVVLEDITTKGNSMLIVGNQYGGPSPFESFWSNQKRK